MTWTRALIALVASGFAASFTDWLFSGVLFHDKYTAYPEIWRSAPGTPETRRIIFSMLLGALGSAALLFVTVCFGAIGNIHSMIAMALAVWIAGPVPVIFTNILWIKMHPLVAVSHSLGWLVRFAITGLIGYWLR